MSELGQEDGRLFFVAGLGSTALFAVACFLALMPVIHRRSRSYRVGAFARSGFARGKPWSPTIDLNSTSPGELLEQHFLAINGLGSAKSTLRTSPNLIRISAETRSVRPKFSRPRAVAQSLSAGS